MHTILVAASTQLMNRMAILNLEGVANLEYAEPHERRARDFDIKLDVCSPTQRSTMENCVASNRYEPLLYGWCA